MCSFTCTWEAALLLEIKHAKFFVQTQIPISIQRLYTVYILNGATESIVVVTHKEKGFIWDMVGYLKHFLEIKNADR